MSTVSRNIGTELLFENDRLRVWDMTLAPGEASEVHKHVQDYLFVYATPGNNLEVREEGREPWRRSFEDGYVQYTVVGKDGLVPHQLANVGEATHRQLLVEFLRPSEAREPLEPETNGRFS